MFTSIAVTFVAVTFPLATLTEGVRMHEDPNRRMLPGDADGSPNEKLPFKLCFVCDIGWDAGAA